MPSSEIYPDAQAGFWEYGPLGVELKNRFIELWRREMVRRDEMVEIDGAQVMPRSVFEASGHLESFADPLLECTKCGFITRADKFIAERTFTEVPERLKENEYDEMIREYGLSCPNCNGDFKPTRRFNMMFKLEVGPSGDVCYLRPETCQSIFVDFLRLYRISRLRLPIAFAQVGKSFRNELSPRQGVLRLREFYQAEIEVFFNPARANDVSKFSEVESVALKVVDQQGKFHDVTCKQALDNGLLPNKLIGYYLGLLVDFYSKTGLDMARTRLRILKDDERAFYSRIAFDFEVDTSLGWVELVACNYRGDYDLMGHSKVSRQDLSVMDQGEKVLPHIFELSMGVDRSLYCILEHALVDEGERRLLKLKPYLAPIQVGVLPLVTKDGLPEKAQEIHNKIKLDFRSFYDDSGSIGRRYRRLDEIGTPYNITIDYQTLNDDTVTIRRRDEMSQTRVPLSELSSLLSKLLR